MIYIYVYISIIRPDWSYDIPTTLGHKKAFGHQHFSDVLVKLSAITSAPWYITNINLQKNSKISTLNQLVKSHY